MSVALPAPRLAVTTILAFGDSITEGEVPVSGEFSLRPQFVEANSSYPADLTTMLAQRYTVQGATRLDAFSINADNSNNMCGGRPATSTMPAVPLPPRPTTSGILVINDGCLGEAASAQQPSTLGRLGNALRAYHPDLVLILEGTNDLGPSDPSAGVQAVVNLVNAALGSGSHVMVSTLLPQIQMDFTHGGAPSGLIVQFNAQLVPAARSAGAQIVDLYTDINSNVTAWISPYDGLHPTEAGYQEMARVWFSAIRDAYEVPGGPSVTTAVPARSSAGVRAVQRR